LFGSSVDSGPFNSLHQNGYIGDLIRLQMSIDTSAVHGVIPQETLTLAYDEV